MKGDSDIFMNTESFDPLKDDLKSLRDQSIKVFENLINKNSPSKKNYTFLNRLWKKLIINPQSFYHTPNFEISGILEEEAGTLAFDAANSVLSEELNLPINSPELLTAHENSIKIFHEDYPFDFILEYEGERLGIFMWDKCFNSAGEATPVYRFNPDIKDFSGLF